jgi:hypothetical protein
MNRNIKIQFFFTLSNIQNPHDLLNFFLKTFLYVFLIFFQNLKGKNDGLMFLVVPPNHIFTHELVKSIWIHPNYTLLYQTWQEKTLAIHQKMPYILGTFENKVQIKSLKSPYLSFG